MAIDSLLNNFDIYYKVDSTKMGFMLAKDRNGVKRWRRQDGRGLPDNYAPGDISYANLAPDVQKTIAHRYFHGGLGAVEYEVDDDALYNLLRSLKTVNIDTRCKGKAYPGPKIITITIPSFQNPTSHNDPDTAWTDETKVYDNDTGTSAQNVISLGTSWGNFLELNIAEVFISAIRFWATGTNITEVDIDLYYDSAWNHLYEGVFTANQWNYIKVSGGKKVTAARVRFYNSGGAETTANFHEFDFFASSTSGIGDAIVSQCDFNNKRYFASGKILLKLATYGIGEEYLMFVKEFANDITHLEALGDNLYIALGASNKYWYMDTDETFTESTLTNGEADKFRKVSTKLWQLKLPNKVRVSTNPLNGGSWGVEILVGESAYNVNDMLDYQNLLYCMKENGVFYVDASDNVQEPFPELRSMTNSESGKNSVVAFNKIYFRMGQRQELEIEGNVISEVTPSLFAPGVSEYTYWCTARAQDDRWVYALMPYSGDLILLTGRREYIAGKTRWVWHDIRRFADYSAVTSAMVSSVQGRPYLYITAEFFQVEYFPRLLKVYIPVTNDATADSGYKFYTSGKLYSPRYCTLLLAFLKRWRELYGRSQNLTETTYINVYYSTDEWGSSTLLGKLDDSPEKTLSFGAVESTMLNLRLDFAGGSETTPPILNYYDIKALTMMPSVTRFYHTIKCADGLRLKKNILASHNYQAQEIRAFIETIRDKICTLGDPWGNEHTVKVRVTEETDVYDEDKPPDVIYSIEAMKL